MPRGALIAALALALAVGACSSAGDGDQHGVTVVATTNILGDVIRNVVGSDADVEVLIPTGADPHDFQPSSRQVAALVAADLVVANGLGLEEGLLDALESAERDGASIVYIAEALDPIPFSGDHDDDHDEVDHEAADHETDHDGTATLDPHVWLDPIRMTEAARLVADALSALDPSIDWAARAEDYAGRLVDSDRRIQEILSAIPAENRKLVTNHDALGYFAARYDFVVVDTVVPGGATLGEPSSDELARLVQNIRSEAVKAIFAETTEPTALAEAIAAEVGSDVAVVELFTGSLGGTGSGAESLIELLESNAERIAAALS